jgi:fumarylacetoacetase
MMDETHDPKLQSWVESAYEAGCDFPIQNLPLATYRHQGRVHLGAGIGDQVFEVRGLSMEAVMAMRAEERVALRRRLSRLLARGSEAQPLTPMSEVELLLPCIPGDYTDFYASIDHATNVGKLFRPDNPLLPNYRWVPIAYHGRSSSIVVSGTPVRRPCGQLGPEPPTFGPTRKLDYEVELGAWLGPGNAMGEPIPAARAEEHLVGVCLLNDWSARDIQGWEYQPLGPFLAKNFATSISPWVVTREALEPFRCAAEDRDETLPYLRGAAAAYRITLEVWLNGERVSRSEFSRMYWTLGQMIAHHTSNGCPLRAGDLLGSGTVSGPEVENRGCLLELGRPFLADGDEVLLKGWCEAPGYRRIGLGECRGVVTAPLG